MSASYARITAEQTGNAQEISLQSDGGLLLSSLTDAYPNATGIYYQTAETETVRLQLSDDTGVFYPPDDDKDWTQNQYSVAFTVEKEDDIAAPKEEQSYEKPEDPGDYSHYYEENDNERGANGGAAESDVVDGETKIKCKDLIVLNLPFETKEKELREYFETFGPVDFCEVKMRDGRSRGFGFVRFFDIETQRQVLSQEDMEIGGRKINVSRPACQIDEMIKMCNNRLFVAKLSNEMTEDDLRSYFAKFGTVTDAFRPPGARGFAFVSFKDVESVYEALDYGDEHVISGKRVIITCAEPKNKDLPPDMRKPRQMLGGRSRDYGDGRVFHRFGHMGGGGRPARAAPLPPRRGVPPPPSSYYYDPYYYDPYGYDYGPPATYGIAPGPVPAPHGERYAHAIGSASSSSRREVAGTTGRKNTSRSRSPQKPGTGAAATSSQQAPSAAESYPASGATGYYEDYYGYADPYGYGAVDPGGYYY